MDMQIIVKDLLETGLSQTELSRLAGCAPHTITRYLSGDRGKRPSYALAAKLVSLHKARCKRKPSSGSKPPITSPP